METLTAMLDSLRPADSARSAETTQHRRPTSKDILAGGYNCQREIPEPVECEFCGRKLYHEALVMGRTVLMFAPFPQRCTCDRAKAKWEEADAEEARQKAEAEKEAAQAKRRAKIERLLGRSGIKKRFQQRTFANFIRDTPERRRCYDTAKTYADSFPQRAERGEGLYIEGTYGTGKTHLAAAIALQLIGCGVPVVCKTSGDLLADIKEAFDSGDATEYEILKAYKTVDLLIVDDLGKEQCTEWSVSTLYSILNDRYEDMKPTIITTNYNADELVRALTPKGGDGTKARAIISRLREVSTVITMPELRQEYLDILEKRDWSVSSYTDDGRVEIEWYSPAGEDFIICVGVEKFPDEVLDYSDSFDVDEHIAMWIEAKQNGTQGVPGARQIVHDAEEIEKELDELAFELQEAERKL